MFCVSYVDEQSGVGSCGGNKEYHSSTSHKLHHSKEMGFRVWSVWCWIERALCGRGWGASAIGE